MLEMVSLCTGSSKSGSHAAPLPSASGRPHANAATDAEYDDAAPFALVGEAQLPNHLEELVRGPDDERVSGLDHLRLIILKARKREKNTQCSCNSNTKWIKPTEKYGWYGRGVIVNIGTFTNRKTKYPPSARAQLQTKATQASGEARP